MTNDKELLLKQMEQQRFSQITPSTIGLYDAYEAILDTRNSDELSYLLFYKGEYFFRIGNFNESLSLLTRCIQAPKQDSLKYLDVLVHNVIGLIYIYLGHENIAINSLLEGKALCEELKLSRELSVCCGNLGNIYTQLQDYDTALYYYDQAIEQLAHQTNPYYNLALLCEANRGTIYCKTNQSRQALLAYQKVCQMKLENDRLFYDASVYDLNIRLFDFTGDTEALQHNLNQLLSLISSSMDFLESSESYFDVCDYLLEKHLQSEAFSVLNYINQFIEKSPLVFLKYEYLKRMVTYTRLFSNKEVYLSACSQLVELQPEYQSKQRSATLFGLEYMERLHEAKNDSDHYRQKSQIDQMTGLLNKYTIQFFIEEDLSHLHAGKQSAMILVDLDHFKQINDTLGHLAGDSFICKTSSIIQGYFKDEALCGRVGGDEFLIYLSDIPDTASIVLQSEILRQEIFRQTSKRNIIITTQASIGISFSSEFCYDYESMFSAADHALYRAKMEGRNKVVVAE